MYAREFIEIVKDKLPRPMFICTTAYHSLHPDGYMSNYVALSISVSASVFPHRYLRGDSSFEELLIKLDAYIEEVLNVTKRCEEAERDRDIGEYASVTEQKAPE